MHVLLQDLQAAITERAHVKRVLSVRVSVCTPYSTIRTEHLRMDADGLYVCLCHHTKTSMLEICFVGNESNGLLCVCDGENKLVHY